MSSPKAQIALASESRVYQPGGELVGRFFVDDPQPALVRAAELSILWYTVGKGEEDMGVHFFHRYGQDSGVRLDVRTPHAFDVKLPQSPLSYDGLILKICWCVRVRFFLSRGHESVAETPFRLGDVQPGQLQRRSP